MDITNFKLPIDYISTVGIDSTMISDLELISTVDPSGIPIYSRVFNPTDEASTIVSKKWNKYTTDVAFLQETQELRKLNKPPPIDNFVEHWTKIKNNSEFKITYQYIEYAKLSYLNTSPTFLSILSFYFITSPLLFFLSPIFMLLIPFIIMRLKNIPISWAEYRTIFQELIKTSAIGGLFLKFSESNTQQRMYLIVTAIFFCMQLYSNIYSFYTFLKNIRYIHVVIHSTKKYLKQTLLNMEQVQHITQKLVTHRLFHDEISHHKNIIESFYKKINTINPSSYSWSELTQLGKLRATFYELKMDEPLHASIQYSFGLYGFIHNMASLQKLNNCTYSDKTTFKNAYYPISKPIKNSYNFTKNMVITGPNASGKTTFIKQTMINVLLAQQIGCGFYKKASICPVETLCCYINIPDTSGRDSLFQAEARRCKEVINAVSTSKSIFCIFDELFSGTNPTEASASAYAFIEYLSSQSHCKFLLTTHFLDVCDKVSTNEKIKNIHLETIDGPQLKYTYKIADGISRIKGGLHILKMLDYPASILKCAKLCG